MSWQGVLTRLRFKNGELGYVKVSDGSVIILRVAVIDVRVREERTPFGPEFDVIATGGISVYPSESALNEVKDKPMLEPGKAAGEGWTMVDIVEGRSAYEEVVYNDEKVGSYLIRVELEPIMVSKNASFKTVQGLPLYVVRWVPKVSWRQHVEIK